MTENQTIKSLMYEFYDTASKDCEARLDYICKGKKLIDYLLAGLFEILHNQDLADEIFIEFIGDEQSFLELLVIMDNYQSTGELKSVPESSLELFNDAEADQLEVDIAGLQFYAYICSLALMLNISLDKVFLLFDDANLLERVCQSIVKNNQAKIMD